MQEVTTPGDFLGDVLLKTLHLTIVGKSDFVFKVAKGCNFSRYNGVIT